ncbi:MAG: YdeI family protein [Marinobacter sp.]|nr:YdeI family protein [Marinobacter sp.]
MNQITGNERNPNPSADPNPKVDAFMAKAGQWRQEFELLRKILLDCPLAEGFKWGKPCYAYEGANVVLMHGFKDYCALLFMKGALLKDPEGILVAQTKNVQSARQIRFTSVQEIAALEPTLKAYVQGAVAVEKAGLEVEFKKTEDFSIPEEFQYELARNPALKAAFDALTPGRQRGYLLHFSGAKQASTRASRVEKCVPKILEGKGLNDR